MENVDAQTVAGMALILGAVSLTSDPVYTAIKGAVVKAGGSIDLGAAIRMGLIALVLVGGSLFFETPDVSRPSPEASW